MLPVWDKVVVAYLSAYSLVVVRVVGVVGVRVRLLGCADAAAARICARIVKVGMPNIVLLRIVLVLVLVLHFCIWQTIREPNWQP